MVGWLAVWVDLWADAFRARSRCCATLSITESSIAYLYEYLLHIWGGKTLYGPNKHSSGLQKEEGLIPENSRVYPLHDINER